MALITKDMINNDVETIIEDIQEAIVGSGGMFFRKKSIEEMTIKTFLDMACRNNIAVKIYKE